VYDLHAMIIQRQASVYCIGTLRQQANPVSIVLAGCMMKFESLKMMMMMMMIVMMHQRKKNEFCRKLDRRMRSYLALK